MLRTMLKSTIHRATVTRTDPDAVGSVTVDRDLMEAADLVAGEQVAVLDVSNGTRLETWVVAGERGSGVVAVNGVPARLLAPGAVVVVVSHGALDPVEARSHEPRIVVVDADNRIVERHDPAHAPEAAGLPSGAEAAETPDATRLDALISPDPQPAAQQPVEA